MNAAVMMAMEMESYLSLIGSCIAHVNAARSEELGEGLEVVAVARSQNATIVMKQKRCKRLDKLKFMVERVMEMKKYSGETFICRDEGHFACDCPKLSRKYEL